MFEVVIAFLFSNGAEYLNVIPFLLLAGAFILFPVIKRWNTFDKKLKGGITLFLFL